jgi:hypothetical protein
MKNFIITESEKKDILRMYNVIGLREQTESGQTTPVTISDVQQQATELDSNLPVQKYADPTCPCAPKLTGDSEKDGIIKQAYRWAKGQTVKTLFKEAKRLKKEGKLNEQAVVVFTILGTAVTASTLIVIGAILLFIIIVVILLKNKGKGGGSCNPGWWDDL